MATTYRTSNPLIQRIQSDGVFGAGLPQPDNQLSTESKLNNSMNGTFNASRSGLGPQTDFGAINTAANQPTFDASMFGGVPSLANLGLHPSGGPTTSYAPTGLRQQAIAAGGAPVTGFGGAQVTAAPNAQGGMAFSLTQAGMPQGAQGMIDPNPTPAAMQFLQDGVAPTNPGPFPRLGVPAAQTVQQVPPQPPVSNAIFSQNQQPLPGGLGNYLPKGNPQQIKAQLGLAQQIQKMQQEAVERNAVAAAHASGVDDPLSAYLQNGGRDMGVINSFKKNALAEQSLGMKQDAASKKAADAAQGHATTLSQINEQNNAVMGNIDKALSLADSAGPIAGGLVGKGMLGNALAPKEVKQLHSMLDSISGNEMMDYIQRLKAANPAGTIGFRVLDTEAKAMANVFAAIKNDKIPLEQQDPAFVKEQLNNLKYHLGRMNAIANGKDPESVQTGVKGSTVNAPEGVDSNIWSAMTPQERALWQK